AIAGLALLMVAGAGALHWSSSRKGSSEAIASASAVSVPALGPGAAPEGKQSEIPAAKRPASAVPPATRAAKRAAREKPTETVRETFDASRFLAPKRARPGERVLSADAPPPSMEVAGIVPARGLPATPVAPVVAPPPPAPKAEAPAPQRPRAGGDFQEPKL